MEYVRIAGGTHGTSGLEFPKELQEIFPHLDISEGRIAMYGGDNSLVLIAATAHVWQVLAPWAWHHLQNLPEDVIRGMGSGLGGVILKKLLKSQELKGIKAIEQTLIDHGRVQAEQGRVQAEQGRIQAEQGRIQAEQGRIQIEQGEEIAQVRSLCERMYQKIFENVKHVTETQSRFNHDERDEFIFGLSTDGVPIDREKFPSLVTIEAKTMDANSYALALCLINLEIDDDADADLKEILKKAFYEYRQRKREESAAEMTRIASE